MAEIRVPGAPGSVMLLVSSVTLGKSLGKQERKLASAECNALSRMSSSLHFSKEGSVLILHGRTLAFVKVMEVIPVGKWKLGLRPSELKFWVLSPEL